MSDFHEKLDAYLACIIKEASDKPIKINVARSTPAVLIVNQATGDVFVQNFSAIGPRQKAIDYGFESLKSLQLGEFMGVNGEKRAFVLESGLSQTVNISQYLEQLANLGIEVSEPIKANPTEEFLEKFGDNWWLRLEYPFTYEIDLKTPQALKISIPDFEDPSKILDMTPKELPVRLEPVGSEKSTLPDIKKIEKEYSNRIAVLLQICYGDLDDLAGQLKYYKDSGLATNKILDLSDKIGIALQHTLKNSKEDFFSCEYLYKSPERTKEVIKILNFLQSYENNAIPKEQIAGLAACAAKQLQIHWRAELASGEATDLQIFTPAANELIGFAKNLLEGCGEDEQKRIASIIKPDFTKLIEVMNAVEQSVNATNLKFTLEVGDKATTALGNLLTGAQDIKASELGGLLENKPNPDLPDLKLR